MPSGIVEVEFKLFLTKFTCFISVHTFLLICLSVMFITNVFDFNSLKSKKSTLTFYLRIKTRNVFPTFVLPVENLSQRLLVVVGYR